MTLLSVKDVKEIAKTQPRRDIIQQGILIADRLRFHTDAVVGKIYTSSYYKKYISYVESFIEDEVKRQRFKTFLNNPPFPTVEITEKIWRKRDRIFNAADPYEKLEFNNPEIREDADAYLDSIMFNSTFKNELNEYRKTSPNSFWVVDAKEEQTTSPEPYCYIVDIENVLDYIDTPMGLQWVIYKDCKNISEDYPYGRLIAIDAEKYIVVQLDEGEQPLWETAKEVIHGLEKTPAGQLSTQPLRKQDYQVKSNIIVNQLSNLDTFLFAKISKRYLDSYMFPIIEKIEEECNYRDSEGNECEGGYTYSQRWCPSTDTINYPDGGYNEHVQTECPDCKARRIIGAGTVIEKAAPDSETPLVVDAVKFVTPPVDYLGYSKDTMQEYEEAIVKNTIGQITIPREALNELQVESAYEDRKDVLLDEAKEMAKLKKNIVSCMMNFKYGDRFLESNISFGREFYLYSVADLENRKKLLIENGASQTELMQLQEKIIATEYQTNPSIQTRMLMLLHLEPFALLNLEQTNNLLQNGVITKENFEKKIKFDKLVRRFEREQGNITEFVIDAPLSRRIELIDNILNGYLDEERETTNDVRESGLQEREGDERIEQG